MPITPLDLHLYSHFFLGETPLHSSWINKHEAFSSSAENEALIVFIALMTLKH